jgi:RNA polymerase sigma-70 factor (ECF subfamily)
MPGESSANTENENANLINLIMAGDRGAADLLFALYMPQLRRAAGWVLPNPQDSEDALQDGLLLAYRNLNQFQGRAKFSTWLHRIVVNSALMKLRRQRARPTTSISEEVKYEEDDTGTGASLIDPRPSPEQEYITHERSRILAQMLEALPATSRMVIQLTDIQGISGREAAQRLGITPSALKARHHRARQSILQKRRRPQEELNA